MMGRLTRWNGVKYLLPQGRTSDGQSYWRLIADKLGAYEDTGIEPEEILKMKEIMMSRSCECKYIFLNKEIPMGISENTEGV